MNKKGFTLIEIMITIAIIAILSVVGMTIFNSAQKSSRDQVRVRDLQIIKQALELYRSDYGTYPYDKSALTGSKYLAAWPTDPVGQSYLYIPSLCNGLKCGGFVVCAKGEGSITGYLLSQCTSHGSEYNIGLRSD